VVQVTTLTPTAVTAPGWDNIGGAASQLAAITDSSDATYLRLLPSQASSTIEVTLPAATLQDGAGIESVEAEFRCAADTVGQPADYLAGKAFYAAAPDVFASNGSLIPMMSTTPQTQVDASGIYNPAEGAGPSAAAVAAGLKMTVTGYPTPRENGILVHKVLARVKWSQAPTPSAIAPAAGQVTATTRPRFEWTTTSPDGKATTEVLVAVWALADVQAYPGGQAAFEASMDTPFADAAGQGRPSYSSGGVKTAKAWSTTVSGPFGWQAVAQPQAGAKYAWTPNQDLPFTGTHVVYLRAAGQLGGQQLKRTAVAGRTSASFTMNVGAPPVAPTSVAAAWQYPGAALAGNRNELYRMKVDVVVPTQTMTGWDKAVLQVEHAPQGSTDWQILPVGTVTPAQAAGTYTVYDTLAVPGRAMQYRARVVLSRSSDGAAAASAYATAGSTVTAVFDCFVLRDPASVDLAVPLPIQGDLESSSDERLQAHTPLGAPYPVTVSDVVGAASWPITATTRSAAAASLIRAIRARRATLVLQGDMDGWWRWVRFGPQVQERILRSASRKAAATRATQFTFQLDEVAPAYNQPPSTWGA